MAFERTFGHFARIAGVLTTVLVASAPCFAAAGASSASNGVPQVSPTEVEVGSTHTGTTGAAPGDAPKPSPTPASKVQGEDDDAGPDDELPVVPRRRLVAPTAYRNPQGSIALSAILFGSFGSGGESTFVIGVGVGYAVVTGVVPGVRGALVAGGGSIGGDLAATLTLTPPVSWYITPFAVGEVGRRFDDTGGWLYGAGGGIYIGEPSNTIALQVGWIFRRIVYPSRTFDANYPIIAISARF